MSLLFTPVQIGNLALASRLVMPPMATAKADEAGRVTDDLCDYYAARAGGVGLVIMEHSFISPEGKAKKGQLSIAEDGDLEGLRRLTEVIHSRGGKVMAQINHAGGAAQVEEAIAPSAVRLSGPGDAPLPREMTEEDIAWVVHTFAAAALRARKAGFDGVEIHSAHGYLLNQFYSPLTNHRRDAYNGQSLEGRLRIHMEIIRAVRAEVGKDYPLALRLGACDYMDGGTTLEDSAAAGPMLQEAGIDLLDISGGLCGYRRPGREEQGYFAELSEAVRQKVSIPVLLTGGVVEAAAAEALLADGKADLIGVGRAILKDAAWAEQAAAEMRGR